MKSFDSWMEDRCHDSVNCHERTLRNSIYRIGSDAYIRAFADARKNRPDWLDPVDAAIIDETEIGDFGEFDGQKVPLDVPMIAPESHISEGQKAEYDGKEVELNEPARGGSKKYYVYTRNPKTGKVVRVEFGYPGMDVGTHDLERSKNFAARHKCSEKKDRTKPGYWSCVLPRYAKQLGLSEPAYKYW